MQKCYFGVVFATLLALLCILIEMISEWVCNWSPCLADDVEPTKLYIGGLDPSTNRDQLKKLIPTAIEIQVPVRNQVNRGYVFSYEQF